MTRLSRLTRGLVLIAAIIPSGLAVAACSDDDDDDDGTPTTAVTTTATAVTERTPSPTTAASTTSTPGSSATAPAGTARRTKNAAIDSVLAAVEARDPAKLAAIGSFIDVGCTTAQGLGGPPKCKPGQPEGTVVRVFPFAGCEGSYIEPAQLQATLAQEVTSQNAQVYAVTVARQATNPEPYFPSGDFNVFLDVKGATAHGVMLALNQSGQLVNMWTGCGGSATQVYEARKGDQVLLPPLQMGG